VVPAPGCSATSGGGSGGGGSGGGGGGTFTEAKITGGPYVLANCASSLTLDGSASTSFDGQPLAFQWDFWLAATQEVFTVPAMGADGATPAIPDATAPLSMATHTWLQPGQTYDVTLNVQDSTGVPACWHVVHAGGRVESAGAVAAGLTIALVGC
jgi:hypothetical protein